MKKLLITATILLFSINSKSNECGEYFDNLLSPFCTDAKYIFLTGAATTFALYSTKRYSSISISRRLQRKNYLKNWGEIGAEVGFGVLNTLYIVANVLDFSPRGYQNAEHMAEASIYSLGITMGMKTVIQQRRPGFPQYEDSFPSGHTSAGMAFASVIHARHGLAPGVMAYLFAIYVAYSRINDSWHYLHDVVAGATIGLSYGWGIYLNHEKYKKPYWLGFHPIITPNRSGLMLTLKY